APALRVVRSGNGGAHGRGGHIELGTAGLVHERGKLMRWIGKIAVLTLAGGVLVGSGIAIAKTNERGSRVAHAGAKQVDVARPAAHDAPGKAAPVMPSAIDAPPRRYGVV